MRRWLLLALLCAGCRPHLVWYGRSDDRRHIAAVIEQAQRQRFRFDLVDGPSTRGIPLEGIVLGTGGHFAYAAQREDGWVVFHDGRPGRAYDGIGEVTLSDDGTHLAYAAQRGSQWLVVRDGAEDAPVDEVSPRTLRFSSTGRVRYVAVRAGRQLVFTDGVPGEPWDTVTQLQARGESVTYLARRRAETFAVIDGVVHGPYAAVASVSAGPPSVIALDGRLLIDGKEFRDGWTSIVAQAGGVAWTARRDDGLYVVTPARTFGPFREFKPDLLVDAEGHAVFAGRRGDDWYVISGRAESGPWVDVKDLAVAGAHVAFLGILADEDVVVHDGRQLSRWQWANTVTLSPDGARVAWLARRDGQSRLVVDGEEHPFELVIDDTVAFSSDGRRAGCVTGNREKRQLHFSFDDGRREPLDFEELVAEQARGATDPHVLRRWVRAELDRLGGGDAGSP